MYTKVRNFIVLLAILTVMTSSLTGAMPVLAQANAIPQPVSGKTVKCPMPLPATEIEGKTIICGQIEVPENWDKPTGRLITLTYARQVSKNLAPIADPIIFFAGGPGGSVLAAEGSASFDFTFLRETRYVIVWDQRGTRYSADLRCPLDVQVPDDADRQAKLAALGEPKFTLKSDPQAMLDYMSQALDIDEGTSRCAAYFAKQGIDVAQYNTPNTVRDAIALMNYLGYPAYNLLGISYGTQVALAIADYYGQNPDAKLPPIRSILIDGVYPVNLSAAAEDALVKAYNALRIFAECEADAACGKAYPKIRQRLIDLLASLESAPLKTAAGTEITLDNLREMLFKAVETKDVTLIAYLPRMVDELSRGETATYDVARAIIAGQVQPAAAPAATSILDPVKAETASLAQELRTIAGRLDTLGGATGGLAQAINDAKTLPELYVKVLNQYLESVSPEERNVYANIVASAYAIHPEQQTRHGLVKLAESRFSAAVAGELTAIANTLTDVEVRQVWDTLTDDRTLQALQMIDNITNFVVKCNDRSSTFKTGPALDLLGNFEAPQLATGIESGVISAYEARCKVYGIEASTYAIPPAVTTAYPILVMNGGLDHATPVEWGELAFKTLTNAKLVIIPLSDHGTIRYSKCAKDIANTFFLYPEAELNTTCVEALRPVFVLPDATLPPVATK